jgi:hypothetical protein
MGRFAARLLAILLVVGPLPPSAAGSGDQHCLKRGLIARAGPPTQLILGRRPPRNPWAAGAVSPIAETAAIAGGGLLDDAWLFGRWAYGKRSAAMSSDVDCLVGRRCASSSLQCTSQEKITDKVASTAVRLGMRKPILDPPYLDQLRPCLA